LTGIGIGRERERTVVEREGGSGTGEGTQGPFAKEGGLYLDIFGI